MEGKDAGKQGVVSMVYQERNWVTIQHLNLKIKTMKEDENAPAVVFQEEQPLRVTDQVSLIDPSDM